jgi:predicted RNA polymerase sigma factor
LHAIAGSDRLAGYPFYHAALGGFELRGGKPEHARDYFVAALALARNPMERRFLEHRIAACSSATPLRVAQ